MVVGLPGNESPDSNRTTLITPKSENDVRLRATLGSQNPTGLPVGAVRKNINMDVLFVKQGEYEKGDAAFPLIAEVVNAFFALSEKPGHITEESIRRTPEGRPYCSAAGDTDISVTHSGDIWMCLVSDGRCGVDFQYCRGHDSIKIVNRYYTEGEREYIEGGQTGQYTGSFIRTGEGRSGRFFDVWVRREALGKYEGHGFFGNYPDSAPSGVPAESMYFINDNTKDSKRIFVHEITRSMLVKEGVHAAGDFRAVCVSGSSDRPVIRRI